MGKKKISQKKIGKKITTDAPISEDFDVSSKTEDELTKTFQQEEKIPTIEYRIPIPFGSDDETMLVSKEDFEERTKCQENGKKEERERQEAYTKFNQEMDNIGYNKLINEETTYEVSGYKTRIKEVLSQKKINDIKSIPGYKEETTTKGVTLFQTLEVKNIDKKEDPYYKKIVDRLDTYEKIIAQREVKDEERDFAMKIFIMGNINDPHLFYRFEGLKVQYKKYYFQRKFWYGADREGEERQKEISKKPFLTPMDIQRLVYHMRYYDNTLADLDIDEKTYIDRMKFSYQQDIKGGIGGAFRYPRRFSTSLIPDDIDIYSTLHDEQKKEIQETIKDYSFLAKPGRRETMLNYERNSIILSVQKKEDISNDNDIEKYKKRYYDGCYTHEMQKFMGIPRETLQTRRTEAKKEFIVEFIQFVDKISFEFLGSPEYLGTIHCPYPENISFRKLPDVWQRIEAALPHYPDITFPKEEIKKKIIQKSSQYLQDIIQRIKDKYKEKSLNDVEFTSARRKKISYKHQIKSMIDHGNEIHEVLKGLGASNATMNDRASNKELYQKEYCDYHREQFISTKIANILQENAVNEGDREEIKKMVIKNGTKELIESCIHQLAKRKYHAYDIFARHKSMTNRIMYSCLSQKTLFHKGYATLMKHTRPDDKERKNVRREVIQKIIEKCLHEIDEKLVNHSTFDDKLYHLIEPLKHRHEKYGGQVEKISLSQTEITENYLLFLEHEIIKQNYIDRDHIKKIVDNKNTTKDELIKAYNEIGNIVANSDRYIGISLKERKIDLNNKYRKEEKEHIDISATQGKIDLIDFWKGKNKKHEGIYPEEFLRLVAYRRLCIDDIEENFSPDICQHFKTIFQEIVEIKQKFWKIMLGYRVAENTGTNRKLNRIIDEQICRQFGLIQYDEEQINFAIDYIVDNMESIIISDVKINVVGGGYELFWTDRQIIKEILQEVLSKWKQAIDAKRSLGGTNTQKLT